jgi:hypothetical protein
MILTNHPSYMQFHPLAYIVKLKIEMSMADLIAKVARKRDYGLIADDLNGAHRGSRQPNKGLKPLSRNLKPSVHEIDQKSDQDSIELQQLAEGSLHSEYRQHRMDSSETSARGSSSLALPENRAIYTTQEISVAVESAPSGYESGSAAGKGDNNTNVQYNDCTENKAMGLRTNIWADDNDAVRAPPPAWQG